MDLNSVVNLLQGSAGGLVVAVFFFRYLYTKLAECEKNHERMVRAIIAVAASDAKIGAAEVAKILGGESRSADR